MIKIFETPKLNFREPAFSAGQYAEDLSQGNVRRCIGRDDLGGDVYEKLFLAGLYALGLPDTADLLVVVTIPYAWRADSRALEDKITQLHWGKVASAERKTVYSVKAKCLPQGALALTYVAHPFEGQSKPDILKSGFLTDIGTYTTDTLLVRQGDASNLSLSRPLGFLDAAKALQKILQKKYAIETTTEEALDALIKKSIVYNGEFDISGDCDHVLSLFASRHAVHLKSTFPMHKQTDLVVSGGGALLLADPLKDVYKHLSLWKTKHPIYDNCFGGLQWAVRHSESRIPVCLDIGFGLVKAAYKYKDTVYATSFRSYVADYVDGWSF